MKHFIRPSSRRDFLRLTLLGAAGLTVGNALPLWAAEPKKKLGVALLGLGTYSNSQLAPSLQQTKFCQLAGVITGHQEKAEAWKQKYQLASKNIYSYENFDRIADNPEIDIVYVVTPPGTHREFVVRAAAAGKHVICEKPMATSVADCEAMIAACQKAKVKLSIGYRLHFDPYHQELKRLQREQDFGPFMKMKSDFGFTFGKRAWRVEKKLAGGGPLMDVGIYIIQGACMAAGTAPVAVTAQEQPKLRPDFFNEVEETIAFKLEFPNGAVCDAVTSYNHNANNFRAEAAKGWFELTEAAFSYRVGKGATSKGPLEFDQPIKQQAMQMDDFADCILTGRATPVPGEMGLRDIQITTAIYEAARTGKRVLVKTA